MIGIIKVLKKIFFHFFKFSLIKASLFLWFILSNSTLLSKSLAKFKNSLVSKLSQIQSIGHFLRTPNGYKVTAPEGYVAVDRVAGAIKLVDRLEFSRANFTAEKDWVKG